MRKRLLVLSAALTLVGLGFSCRDKGAASVGAKFDPNSPIVVKDFYPDSGGIATPMIIEGANFGSDTTGLKVNFIYNVEGKRVVRQGGLVSSNGSKMYVYVPAGLTYQRNISIEVERTQGDKVIKGESPRDFIYKTQTAVTTVVGQASQSDQPTKMGSTLTTSTLSSPAYIVLDDEDNIFIAERIVTSSDGKGGGAHAKKPDGNNTNGLIVKVNLKKDEGVILATDVRLPNAPTFSDEAGLETVYVPDDDGMGYTALQKSAGYAPRKLSALKNEETKDIDGGNWKHSFVVNKVDKMIYCVMWKGQLVRVNPRTRRAEILLNMVGPGNSDMYCMFSPIEPNKLFVSMADKHQIWTVEVDKLEDKDKAEYHGEKYAGRSAWEGDAAGKGWEDGLLKNAKFRYPRQICFTADGKMYIADTGNDCIRVIDTSLPEDKTVVTTPIGLPGSKGYKDGGPEIAKFNKPTGVAVSADGNIVYVADNGNRVIRKLSIE